jgi:hypothetical protein
MRRQFDSPHPRGAGVVVLNEESPDRDSSLNATTEKQPGRIIPMSPGLPATPTKELVNIIVRDFSASCVEVQGKEFKSLATLP